jgi:deoxyribodipyrimidine photo-lyase
MLESRLPYDRRPVVVWFRDDQRLADNPALTRGASSGHPVVCVYIYDHAPKDGRPLGGAARWWLHESLRALDSSLQALGGGLVLLHGAEHEAIETFASAIDAVEVCWNRRYSVAQRDTDTAIKSALKAKGIAVSSFNGHLLREPWTVLTREGKPFQVFSAYWRAARDGIAAETPLPAPHALRFFSLPQNACAFVTHLDALALEPRSPDWAAGLRDTWQCGEDAAYVRLQHFLVEALHGYAAGRDAPASQGTSRLSPYLRFGNISVRQVWYAVTTAAQMERIAQAHIGKFLDELGWREFSYSLLYHLPPLHRVNVRRQFDAMPWRDDAPALTAWQHGRTGYPFVDAGMRELWHTGWMHNRVRMVVASFLVKHLLIDWREGEAWFWDTLVDADEANNPASWQWVAGCGADAAPYFRIFNPVLQGKKFDPHGDYVRRWLPALRGVPEASIHSPSMGAPTPAGPDDTYPQPIVAHQQARQRALQAFETQRQVSRRDASEQD